MKNINFYPKVWQIVPFGVGNHRLDCDGKCIKDMVLRNSYATDMKVSEMNLNINTFCALDSKGQEHFISEISGQAQIPIKGMHTGLFLKSKGILGLAPGTYRAFRFYLDKLGNNIIYSDRVEEFVDEIEFLDFEIVNGLTIKGGESPEAILRFDFVPFKTSGFFKLIGQFFKGPSVMAGKLANSLSH